MAGKRNKLNKDEKVNLSLKFAMIIMFLIGVAVFSYPFVVDSLNNYIDQQRIAQYQEELKEKNKAKAAELKKQKAEENRKLAESKTHIPGMGAVDDPFDSAVGNNSNPGKEYFQEHTVGAIYIPEINVSLPVFDETNDILLDKGATILQGSSFPIGGKDSHSVITGHTGLPDKMLFTDVINLKKGDQFYLDILGDKLAYKINQIEVVLPNELDTLKVVPGEDLVTLVTCTPYMVNSHRLLVTGTRVPYVEDKMDQEINKAQEYHKRRLIEYIALIAAGLLLFFYWVRRKFILVACRKHNYDLSFTALNEGQPVVGETFRLLDYRGRELKDVGTIQLEAVSDPNGVVSFKQLPGNIYRIAAVENADKWPKLKAKIIRVKDSRFKLKGKKKLVEPLGKKKERRYNVHQRGGK